MDISQQDAVIVPALFDAHVHLRQGDLTNRIAVASAWCCDGLIAMPNTTPPIHDPDSIETMGAHYNNAINNGTHRTTIHMTAKWLPRTTPQDVRAAKKAGVIGFKLYPQGATTNSHDGIPFGDLLAMTPEVMAVIQEMEAQDMVLLCHGEAPGFVMDRENNFLPWFSAVARRHKNLRMTLEHITTVSALKTLEELYSQGCRVFGTITLHHMLRTLDNVLGDKIRPDEYCMPIPKRPEYRDTLLYSAKQGLPYLGFGSDSAPHEVHTKYCAAGCAGIFTAFVMAQKLLELFQHDMRHFDAFTHKNALAFYGLKHSGRVLRFERRDWVVPERFGGITNFLSGETLQWQLVI